MMFLGGCNRLFVGLFLAGFTAWADFTVPPLTSPVVDQAGVLNAGAARSLDSLLREVNAHGRAQVQVLVLKSLEGLPIEEASIRVVDKWQLGTKAKDNGVLFLIAIEDRSLRIEVGQGLEGDLPDIYAKRIIEDQVKPYFKAGDLTGGVFAGVQQILFHVDPEFYKSRFAGSSHGQQGQAGLHSQNQYRDKRWSFSDVFIKILLIILFLRWHLRRRRNFMGSNWGSHWGGSGGLGSRSFGSGGGSWSGGGGGFSGGGASGRW